MMEVFQILGLAIAVLYGIGVVVTLIELWRAPHGFEDEQGFHVVQPRRGFSNHPRPESAPHGTLPA